MTTIDAGAVAATLQAWGINAAYMAPTGNIPPCIVVKPIGLSGVDGIPVWLHVIHPDAHDSAGDSGYALRIVHEWMRAIQGGVR